MSDDEMIPGKLYRMNADGTHAAEMKFSTGGTHKIDFGSGDPALASRAVFSVGPTELIRISADGALYVRGERVHENAGAILRSLLHGQYGLSPGEVDFGLFSPAPGYIALAAQGIERFRVGPDGFFVNGVKVNDDPEKIYEALVQALLGQAGQGTEDPQPR